VRYLRKYTLTPVGRTRTPNPGSSSSHSNTLRSLAGFTASTVRLVTFVICLFPALATTLATTRQPTRGNRRQSEQLRLYVSSGSYATAAINRQPTETRGIRLKICSSSEGAGSSPAVRTNKNNYLVCDAVTGRRSRPFEGRLCPY